MAAQLVADIIQHKVDEKKRTAEAERVAVVQRRRRGRAWYFLGALPLLLGLTIWNLARAANRPEVFNAEERESIIRLQIYLAAQGVEAYRDSTGRWPASLRAVGMEDAGLVYETNGRDFSITDTSTSVPLTYHRGDPLAPFAAGYADLKQAAARGT